MLRDDINMLDRAVAQYAPGDRMCDAWLRIKTALVVLGASTDNHSDEIALLKDVLISMSVELSDKGKMVIFQKVNDRLAQLRAMR